MDTNRSTIALNGAVLLLMFGVGLITPLLPGKIFSYSHSTIQIGLLAAAFAFSYVLVQVPLGIVADRYGFKHFITAGYVFCGLAGVFYVLANSSFHVLAGRAVQGLGEAPVWALAPAILSLMNEEEKGKTIGWYNASIHLGLTSGSLLGLILMQSISERHLFMVYILLCFVSAIWTFLDVQERKVVDGGRDRRASGRYSEKRLKLLGEPGIMSVLLGISLYGVGYGAFITILPNYISSVEAANSDVSGLTFVAFYIGITLAQFVGGPIVDSKGRLFPMIGGLFLFSTGMLFFFRIPTPGSIMMLFVSSFGLGFFLVGSLAFINDQVGPESKGFVSGLFYFFWGGGYFLGPAILGCAAKFDILLQGFTVLGALGLGVCMIILISCKGLIGERVAERVTTRDTQ